MNSRKEEIDFLKNCSMIISVTVFYITCYGSLAILLGTLYGTVGYTFLNLFNYSFAPGYNLEQCIYAGIIGSAILSPLTMCLIDGLVSDGLKYRFWNIQYISDLFIWTPIYVFFGILAFLIGFACLGLMSVNNNIYSNSAAAIGTVGSLFSSIFIITSMFILRLLFLLFEYCYNTQKNFPTVTPKKSSDITLT